MNVILNNIFKQSVLKSSLADAKQFIATDISTLIQSTEIPYTSLII